MPDRRTPKDIKRIDTLFEKVHPKWGRQRSQFPTVDEAILEMRRRLPDIQPPIDQEDYHDALVRMHNRER